MQWVLRFLRTNSDTSSVTASREIGRDTCLAAARSRRGSDMPLACHSLPRRRFAALKGKALGKRNGASFVHSPRNTNSKPNVSGFELEKEAQRRERAFAALRNRGSETIRSLRRREGG